MEKILKDRIKKRIKKKFKTSTNFSKILGYKYNSVGLFFSNNFDRINKVLNLLDLELSLKNKPKNKK